MQPNVGLKLTSHPVIICQIQLDFVPPFLLLAPLVGLAALLAAALITANGTLITIATVINGRRKRRKRRSSDSGTNWRIDRDINCQQD